MPYSTGAVSIHCLEVDAKYRLQFQGSDWSEEFSSMETAIRRVAELVVEETEVTAYDREGSGVVITTLYPAPKAARGQLVVDARKLRADEADSADATKLRRTLATKGLRGAVKFLNSLTGHRFTSLYRFDGPTLRRITFYDRNNPDSEDCEEIPVEASYCVFVRDRAKTFAVSDSQNDERVQEHPKCNVLHRYCGVPLLDHEGRMFGSACHFDFEAGEITPREIELLELLSDLLRLPLGASAS